jgi:hypothetical protein
MKIFVSHASVDAELVGHLVELLQLGVGVHHWDIFFSSKNGAIPNGTFFVTEILTKLNAADLVIAVISRSYFTRPFCLQELGAAQARNVAGNGKLYSALVPPVEFADLTAMMTGVQSGRIPEPNTLNELRDLVAAGGASQISTSIWDQKRADFLLKVQPIVDKESAEHLMDKIVQTDFKYARDNSATTNFKLKLNVTFRNETGETIEASDVGWSRGLDELARKENWFGIQLKKADGSWPNAHAGLATVRHGDEFRASIAFEPSLEDEELRVRHENLRTGTLTLKIKVRGFQFDLAKKV